MYLRWAVLRSIKLTHLKRLKIPVRWVVLVPFGNCGAIGGMKGITTIDSTFRSPQRITMDVLPLYATDLVAELDRYYQERSADPSQSEREIWMAVGARLLVRNLVNKVRQLEEGNILSD